MSRIRQNGQEARIRRARNLVPLLIANVRRMHPGEPVPVQAAIVLDAWRALAGVLGFTASMVKEVERRMKEARA